MTTQPSAIFHLSFPVTCLDASLRFYSDELGAALGRRTEHWVDVILFGHQLTLHQAPSQVFSREQRGVRHFGAILGWPAWQAFLQQWRSKHPGACAEVQTRMEGTPQEHIKLLIEDPDSYLIEIKAYRNLASISEAF